MSVATQILTWERYEVPEERWCLVPTESDFRRRITQPYRTACGEVIDGHRYPSGRATVDVRSWSCDCKGADRRPHLHADPWPSRAVVGRTPLCLRCVGWVRAAGVEPGMQ